MELFRRDIPSHEAQEMKAWARENYKSGMVPSSMWHPIIRQECLEIDRERGSVCMPDFMYMLTRRIESVDHFYPIITGAYELSIQGSRTHYSTPRARVLPIDYTSMELQINYRDGGKVHLDTCVAVQEFPDKDRLFDRKEPESNVFGWVPVKLINELYLHLSKY